MKINKLITLVPLILLSIILLCGCASPPDPQTAARISGALSKIMNTDSAHIKGSFVITTRMSSANNNTSVSFNLNTDYDMKKTSSGDIEISMRMKGFSGMDMDMYGTGGKYYMYAPETSDKYIDVTSRCEQVLSENSLTDMSMFDFDAASTPMNLMEDSKTGTLAAEVHLNYDQMEYLIRKVYAQQYIGLDVLSAESQADLLEWMHVSAQYTIYIDKDNNISRFELKGNVLANYQNNGVNIDITASYDVLETGGSVTVELPVIEPDNVITVEELSELEH